MSQLNWLTEFRAFFLEWVNLLRISNAHIWSVVICRTSNWISEKEKEAENSMHSHALPRSTCSMREAAVVLVINALSSDCFWRAHFIHLYKNVRSKCRKNKYLIVEALYLDLEDLKQFIAQELCDSRGGHPGLSVLTSLLVPVDVKLYWTTLRRWSQHVPNICQPTSEDIKQHNSSNNRSRITCERSESAQEGGE